MLKVIQTYVLSECFRNESELASWLSNQVNGLHSRHSNCAVSNLSCCSTVCESGVYISVVCIVSVYE